MLDLDRFKDINDTYGHKVGDTVLGRFATICRQSLRESDIMGRTGGDEFVILFPETTLPEASTWPSACARPLPRHPSLWNTDRRSR